MLKRLILRVIAAQVGLALALAGTAAHAAIRDVCHSGCTYPTIQSAIDAAQNGDEVVVQAETFYEHINFSGKAITVRSTNPQDPAVVATTIIDGSGTGAVVTFKNSETPTSILDGLTIQNGHDWSYYTGGGVSAAFSSPTIQNCVIRDNYAHSGGGLCFKFCPTPTVRNCTVTGNDSYFGGGGIYAESSNLLLQDCTISSNTSEGRGAGIIVSYGGGTIDNCLISGNVTTSTMGGGGVFLEAAATMVSRCEIRQNLAYRAGGIGLWQGGQPTIENCLFVANEAQDSGGAIHTNSPGYSSGTSPNITNCTFVDNMGRGKAIAWAQPYNPVVTNCIFQDGGYEFWPSGGLNVTYSLVPGGYPGTGNISGDPLFAGPGNYHLRGGSPCIDTGSPTTYPPVDKDGYPRPQDGNHDDVPIVDMGVYEYPVLCY